MRRHKTLVALAVASCMLLPSTSTYARPGILRPSINETGEYSTAVYDIGQTGITSLPIAIYPGNCSGPSVCESNGRIYEELLPVSEWEEKYGGYMGETQNHQVGTRISGIYYWAGRQTHGSIGMDNQTCTYTLCSTKDDGLTSTLMSFDGIYDMRYGRLSRPEWFVAQQYVFVNTNSENPGLACENTYRYNILNGETVSMPGVAAYLTFDKTRAIYVGTDGKIYCSTLEGQDTYELPIPFDNSVRYILSNDYLLYQDYNAEHGHIACTYRFSDGVIMDYPMLPGDCTDVSQNADWLYALCRTGNRTHCIIRFHAGQPDAYETVCSIDGMIEPELYAYKAHLVLRAKTEVPLITNKGNTYKEYFFGIDLSTLAVSILALEE